MEDGWAHLMDTEKGTGRYCSADYLTRVRDYDSSEGTPEDPVEPPRTSHLDGVMTVIIDAGHGGSDIAHIMQICRWMKSTSICMWRSIWSSTWKMQAFASSWCAIRWKKAAR